MAKLQQRSTGHVASNAKGNWVNLRDDAGNIQARYHPKLRLLIIQERKTKTLHDLTKYEPSCQAEKTVL